MPKNLYAVNVDLTIYVAADDEADAECEALERLSEESHLAYASAMPIQSEEDVDPDALGSIPWGDDRDLTIRDRLEEMRKAVS